MMRDEVGVTFELPAKNSSSPPCASPPPQNHVQKSLSRVLRQFRFDAQRNPAGVPIGYQVWRRCLDNITEYNAIQQPVCMRQASYI